MRSVHPTLACVLLLAACNSAGGDAPAPRVEARRAVRSAGPHTITLITGDRVRLDGQDLEIKPGPGRERITFDRVRDHDHVLVIPSDAMPLIARGQLDRALFDVTLLVADGHADDQRSDVPLIITGVAPTAAPRLATARGVTAARALPALHAMAVRQPKANGGAAIASVLGTGGKLWLDRKLHVTLDRSVPQIGGDVAHARGFTGKGVTIAVIDSGIDESHPDFAGKIVASQDFTGDGLGTSDVFGHGTHVASIAAGTGAASGGKYAGVAPDAQLLNARVCGNDGSCDTSAMLAAMQWAVVDHGARIVNISIGGPDDPSLDPLEAAVDQLSADYGALFVIAAGNDFLDQSINSPGSAEAALTVGAVDRANQLAEFSSRGPRIGDDGLKPDVTAPGVDIVAARASGVPDIGTPVDDFYQALSGTSMATPHTAGAAALILQQHPAWTGAQIKAQLIGTAVATPGFTAYQQGTGRIDLDRGTRQAVTADPASLSLGVAAFPHDDDPVLVRTVTYHNAGASPVELALAATMTAPDGTPAPDGVIQLSAAQLTVPAGGSAAVDVTVVTSGPMPDGAFAGSIVATSGDVRVATDVGFFHEPSSHDLTVLLHDVDGTDPPFPSWVIFNASGFFQLVATQTARVPDGTYFLYTHIGNAIIVYPHLQLSADTTLVLDNSTAQPFTPTVSDPDVQLISTSLTFSDAYTGGLFSTGFGLESAVVGPTEPRELLMIAYIAFADGFPASKLYHLARMAFDGFPNGWTGTLAPSELASITTRIAETEGQTSALVMTPEYADPDRGLLASIGLGFDYTGPARIAEYVYGPGLEWQRMFRETDSDFNALKIERGNRSYIAGRHTDEQYNQAVLGPAFALNLTSDGEQAFYVPGANRRGDQMTLAISMLSDNNRVPLFTRALVDSQHLVLYRDGTLISEVTDGGDLTAAVPPAPASYRFTRDVVYPPGTALSTEIHAAWTFRSHHTGDADFHPLPLLAMRFLPSLDEHNETASRIMVMPIAFQHQAGVLDAPVFQASLDASFDDGKTWKPVPTVAFGDRGLAVIVHPPGAQLVSLRGHARDVLGSTVDETVTRAYRITAP